MFRKSKYFVLQTAMTLLSPLSSMLIAIRYYRNPISHIFLVIFAFYFGSRMWLGNDATDHYVEMRLFYCGLPFTDIINNPMVFLHSAEPYTFLLKYILSRFTSSYTIFGGTICAIYMILQIHFLTAFKQYFTNGLSFFAGLALLAVFTVVQFSWYQGIRYWPGVFWFMGFFVRYALTKKWYHLVLACLCPLIHFSLTVLPLTVLANYFLMKCRMKVQVTIFLLSFLIRLAQIDFLPYLLQHIPIIDAFYNTLGVSVVDRNDAITIMEDLRADSNLVYSIRSEVIGIGLLMVLLGLRLKKIVFGPNFIYFMSLALTMATIANFEYIDITFYDRFFKVAVLLLAIAVFIAVAENKDLLNGRSIELITLIAIIFAFELVSQFVALRNAYLNPELWFGNFFTDWHGGLDENRMQMWGDLFR